MSEYHIGNLDLNRIATIYQFRRATMLVRKIKQATSPTEFSTNVTPSRVSFESSDYQEGVGISLTVTMPHGKPSILSINSTYDCKRGADNFVINLIDDKFLDSYEQKLFNELKQEVESLVNP